TEKLGHSTSGEAGPHVRELLSRWESIVDRGEVILAAESDAAEALIGGYTDSLAQLIMATLLLEQADAEAARDGNWRKLLVARTFIGANHLADESAVDAVLACFTETVAG